MFKCVIKMFGLPGEITSLREIEVELEDGVNMAEVIRTMKVDIPELEGSVIRTGENRLIERYKFNINGRFYFDGMDFQLHEDDSIALLVPAIGG
jgi:hypothetical protein